MTDHGPRPELRESLFVLLRQPALAYARPPAEGEAIDAGSAVDGFPYGTIDPQVTEQSPVHKLKAVHHELARLMALGFTDTDIGRLTGYSLSHMHTLRRSPAFQNLLVYYSAQRDLETVGVREKIAALAEQSLNRLGEVLYSGDVIDPEWLSKTSAMLLDRCGHGPVQTNRNINTTAVLSSDDLRKLKENARTAQTPNPGPALGQVIDQVPA